MKTYDQFLQRGLDYDQFENMPGIIVKTLLMLWTERDQAVLNKLDGDK